MDTANPKTGESEAQETVAKQVESTQPNTPQTAAAAGEENGDANAVNGDDGEINAVEAGTEGGGGKQANTVSGILTKIKNDPNMAEKDKIDTLCILLQKIVQDNHMLKTEMDMMTDQMNKSNQAKEAVKQLNLAYKKQIDLVREENELRLKEEQSKRVEAVSGYQNTMTDLSTLLETHTGQNTRLRDENIGMAEKLNILVQETAKREKQIESKNTEYQLQIQLLEHQVQKANIEKAEIKADMTKEKLETMQELSLERERNSNLEDTVKLLKEQASIYQNQLEDLSAGAGNNTKTFNHFKVQIDKLTKQMVELDKDTHQWREKYETSAQQVKKMNVQSLEREKEVGQLKKKLDSMVKLNKALSDERTKLSDKIKALEN